MKFRSLAAAVLAALGVIGVAGNAHANLFGQIYLDGSNGLGSADQAAGVIQGASGPNTTFNSHLVNGTGVYGTYSSSDGGTVTQFLGADAASANGFKGGPLGTFVTDLFGQFNAPVAGTYTFTNNLDDGGAFYVDGNRLAGQAFAGSGTKVADNTGDHGPQFVSGTLNLGAGAHNVEFIYYNQACFGCGYTGNQDGSGGGAFANQVTITDPNGNAVTTTPEPTSLALVGIAGAGLACYRRNRKLA